MTTNEPLAMNWNGIALKLTYVPCYSLAFKKLYGHSLAHLTVESEGRQRLPITETGFRSLFTAAAAVEGYGGPERFVAEWLNQEALSEEWKGYWITARQLSLF